MSDNHCPSREELSAFVHATADLMDAPTIADHLDACPACEATVRSFESSINALITDLQAESDNDEFVDEPEYRRAIAAIELNPAFFVAPAADASIDTPVLGRIRDYQLLKELGRGGMGVVYLALHMQLEKRVALKLLTRERTQNPQAISRFLLEMKAVGRLEHPQIVEARDAGVDGDRHFLVMEYVEGIDLAKLVSRVGPLPIPDACQIIREAAQGLQHVHEQGLVHRDIKPSNLMLTSAVSPPAVKILDMGLALLQGSQQDGADLTGTGQVIGTVDYMAPEQVESGHDVDIRADLYSLGCTLYKLLTGRAPFSGPANDTPMRRAIAHVTQKTPAITQFRSDLPVGLAGVVDRLLAKSPDDRPSTPADVAAALEPFTNGHNLAKLANRAASPATSSQIVEPVNQGTSIWPVSPATSRATPVRVRRGLKLLIAAGAAAFVAFGIWRANRSENLREVRQDKVATGSSSQGRLNDDGLTGDASEVAGAEIVPSRPEPADQEAVVRDGTPAEGTPGQPGAEKAQSPVTEGSARESATVYPTAVFGFEERGAGAKGYGSRISDFLLASLAGKPELFIVEREDLKKVLGEQELTLSGLVKPDEAIQLGRLTGAKILISGSVVELDKTLLLSAKIVGTETGRLITASVRGKTSDDLADLAEKLAAEVETTISRRSADLVAKPVSTEDRVTKLKKSLAGKELPKVWIRVAERHIGQATIDPAAETELARLCHLSGFSVIDHKQGNRKEADVILEGEAFSEFATRHGNLVSVKARVEITAVDRQTGERLSSDRQTEIVVDLAEHVAGKTALQHAAAEIAERVLPRIARPAK